MARKRLTAEFGMGSGLAASLRATRPAKDILEPFGVQRAEARDGLGIINPPLLRNPLDCAVAATHSFGMVSVDNERQSSLMSY